MRGRSAYRSSFVIHWINWTLEKLDAPLQVAYEFNERFTARMGDAKYVGGNKGVIRLSIPLWTRTTEIKRRNTIIHEVCHVVAHWMHGSSQGHNYAWRKLMIRCGEKPVRCHNVDRAGLCRAAVASCGCPNGTKVGPVQAKRMSKGRTYKCRKCRKIVKLIQKT